MAKIFELTDDIKQVATDAIDDLIAALGKNCTLVYEGQTIDCDNCIYDSYNKRSSNVYQPGGPIPFDKGQICPKCGGKGVISSVGTTDTVKMLCTWNPREFIYLPGTIEVPYSLLQTKGHIEDLSKILRARAMTLNTPDQPNATFSFTLVGEPIDPGNIIQGKYFVAMWKRTDTT